MRPPFAKKNDRNLAMLLVYIQAMLAHYHGEEFGSELDERFGSRSSADAGWTSATFLEEEIIGKVVSMLEGRLGDRKLAAMEAVLSEMPERLKVTHLTKVYCTGCNDELGATENCIECMEMRSGSPL